MTFKKGGGRESGERCYHAHIEWLYSGFKWAKCLDCNRLLVETKEGPRWQEAIISA